MLPLDFLQFLIQYLLHVGSDPTFGTRFEEKHVHFQVDINLFCFNVRKYAASALAQASNEHTPSTV